MKFVKINSSELHSEEFDEGSWAVSYGDMITLLLSFFVIFFTTDLEKPQKDDLRNHMSEQIASINFMNLDDHKLLDGALNSSNLKIDGTDKAMDGEADGVKNKILTIANDIKVEAIPWQDNLIIKFTDLSFFNSAQTELTPKGEQILKIFAQKYMPYAGMYKLSIKGFTDSKKVKNIQQRKFKDNLELSVLRSVSAMRVLQKNGIPLERIDLAGQGEMVKLRNYLNTDKKLSDKEIDAISRTIVMIIKPEKKESFL
jgi:chemotaxis protein MotB